MPYICILKIPTLGLQSGLGEGQQQGYPGHRHPRDHPQQQGHRQPRRQQEEVDATYRESSAGGLRTVHVPAKHGPYEVTHGGPQRDREARHRGHHGGESGHPGGECEVGLE